MPPENPPTVADQLSMAYLTRHADQARQIIQETGRRFPELKFEEKALLSGIMTCGRCGRRLSVAYTGNPQSRPVYRCDKPNLMMGLPRCMTFGGPRIDSAIARELLRAVEPMAIEAAFKAERMHREQQEELFLT